MTTEIRHTIQDTASQRAGTVTIVLGALALAATAFTYVLSLSDAFNPPDWVRAAGLVWLPIGFFGSPIAYTIARGFVYLYAEAGLVAGMQVSVLETEAGTEDLRHQGVIAHVLLDGEVGRGQAEVQ